MNNNGNSINSIGSNNNNSNINKQNITGTNFMNNTLT
jgi:hypothetical protein